MRRLQKDKGKRLAHDLEDLKESGDLEADADVVVLLYQPDPQSSDRRLLFAKLREGEMGNSVVLAFNPIYVRFDEVPVQEQVPF